MHALINIIINYYLHNHNDSNIAIMLLFEFGFFVIHGALDVHISHPLNSFIILSHTSFNHLCVIPRLSSIFLKVYKVYDGGFLTMESDDVILNGARGHLVHLWISPGCAPGMYSYNLK